MEYIIPSFIAGVLTGLAPCILPVLPVILGGSLTNAKDRSRPFIIIGSLCLSIIVFTILLRQSSRYLGLSDSTLSVVSGVIIVAVGVFTLLPSFWEKLTVKLNIKSQKLMGRYSLKNGKISAVLTGLALGPIFVSCSPTYGLIINQVLPESLITGLINLIIYSLGLGLFLLLIAIFGQRLVSKLGWALEPGGWFRRLLAITFIFIGISIVMGWDKQAESWLLDNFTPYSEVIRIEEKLIDKAQD